MRVVYLLPSVLALVFEGSIYEGRLSVPLLHAPIVSKMAAIRSSRFILLLVMIPCAGVSANKKGVLRVSLNTP